MTVTPMSYLPETRLRGTYYPTGLSRFRAVRSTLTLLYESPDS
jgi:hypothetical protein